MDIETLFGLEGKTALITGGATGIGRMAAEALVRAGARVLLASRTGEACQAVAEELNALGARVMGVNVAGLFDLTQKLLPLLRAGATADDPARVVNVGSVMGEREMGDGAYSYAASKAAVIHLSKILAKELAGEGITVNALAPGPFVSRMTAFATQDETTREAVGNDVPLGRVGRDEDIAGCMLFLCGRGGAYVTGAVIPVSGGINVMSGPNIFERALS